MTWQRPSTTRSCHGHTSRGRRRKPHSTSNLIRSAASLSSSPLLDAESRHAPPPRSSFSPRRRCASSGWEALVFVGERPNARRHVLPLSIPQPLSDVTIASPPPRDREEAPWGPSPPSSWCDFRLKTLFSGATRQACASTSRYQPRTHRVARRRPHCVGPACGHGSCWWSDAMRQATIPRVGAG